MFQKLFKLRQGASITRFRFFFRHIWILLLSHLNEIWDRHWTYLRGLKWVSKGSSEVDTITYASMTNIYIFLEKNCCMFSAPSPLPRVQTYYYDLFPFLPFWDINIPSTIENNIVFSFRKSVVLVYHDTVKFSWLYRLM